MGSRKVTRSQLRREGRSDREQLEATNALKKSIAAAEKIGHVLGEMGVSVGPRGGQTYVIACSCGHQSAKRSPFATYRDGMGHLGEVLGKDQRDRVATVLDGRKPRRATA